MRDLDLLERSLKAALDLVELTAHEDLGDHRAARFEDNTCKLERDRQQLGGARLIAIGDTGQLGREVAGNEIRGAIEARCNFIANRRLAQVSDDSDDISCGGGTWFEID